MVYSITLTSKGQITLPAVIIKKLGLKAAEQVFVELRGNKVIIRKNNWRENLRLIQEQNKVHMKKRGIQLLNDEELDDVINTSAEKAISQKYT